MKLAWVLFALALGGVAAAIDATNSVTITRPEAAAAIEAAPPRGDKDKQGELGKYREIISRAPFRNQAVAAGPAESGGGPQQLKFNGIFRIGNQTSVGIEDTAQRRSLVLKVGQSQDGIEIRSLDETAQSVSLVYNGQPLILYLEKSPAQSGVPMPPPQPGQPPSPVTQPQPYAPPTGAVAIGTNATQQGIQNQILRRKRIIIPREK